MGVSKITHSKEITLTELKMVYEVIAGKLS